MCMQSAYPPHHYIRSVPQRKVHLFTFLQLIQLAAMCAFGFSPLPYLKMVFPVVILLLLPFRQVCLVAYWFINCRSCCLLMYVLFICISVIFWLACFILICFSFISCLFAGIVSCRCLLRRNIWIHSTVISKCCCANNVQASASDVVECQTTWVWAQLELVTHASEQRLVVLSFVFNLAAIHWVARDWFIGSCDHLLVLASDWSEMFSDWTEFLCW